MSRDLMLAHGFVLIIGLAAGALSGVIGTGSSIVLLPVLVFQYGPKQAVPIMAIAALMSNVGKVAAWWREVNWRAFAAYSVTGVPFAALGARTLLILPSHVVDVALGAFFLAMIPGRRWLHARRIRIGLWQLALAGAAIGFVTGIVLSTGPLSVPAFTAYGLAKGAFLSTEAVSSLALMISKAATFREAGALPLPAIIEGLVIGSSVMAGSFLGKLIVQRMSIHAFQFLLDALLFCSGMSLLWAAFGADPPGAPTLLRSAMRDVAATANDGLPENGRLASRLSYVDVAPQLASGRVASIAQAIVHAGRMS